MVHEMVQDERAVHEPARLREHRVPAALSAMPSVDNAREERDIPNASALVRIAPPFFVVSTCHLDIVLAPVVSLRAVRS